MNIRQIRKAIQKPFLKLLYKRQGYLKAYTKHTDMRVAVDPHSAIGAMWDEIGQLQFHYLVSKGLKPESSMLDIGCGTLRGGIYFIKYLDEAKYHGIDLSPAVIKQAKVHVQEQSQEGKKPTLLVNTAMNLKFKDFQNQRFDYLLAQSVFTHLLPEHIDECFRHVASVMHEQSSFYFTYHESETFVERSVKDFSYPFHQLKALAEAHGLKIQRLDDYNHPRGQVMCRVMI